MNGIITDWKRMNKSRHPVDEFFSEALKNYKVAPSEDAKNAFLKEAEEMEMVTLPNKSRKGWILLTLSGIILLTGLTGIYFSQNRDKGTVASSPVSKSTLNYTSTGKITGNNLAGTTPGNNISYPTPSKVETATTKQLSLKAEGFIASSSIHPNAGTVSVPSVAMTEEGVELMSSDEIRYMDPLSTTPVESDNSIPPPALIPLSDTVRNQKTIPFTPYDKSLNPKNNYFAAGIYYSPEWMFNTLDANKNMRTDNFGLEGTWHFGPYSVGTGIGLSFSRGTNEIVVGYNDYLGTYKGLDSIVFKWDPTHTYLIPIYYYTDQIVYDSLLKLDYSYYEKQYIYLQIPLALGYDFIRNKNFTLGARLRPSLSILIQSKGESPSIDLGKDRIVQLNDVTPERVQTNWQIGAGINATIGVSYRFVVEIEPDVRYYFNSVYEKPDEGKKPWSVGFRVALLFRN
jgi:hypothetical protein